MQAKTQNDDLGGLTPLIEIKELEGDPVQ